MSLQLFICPGMHAPHLTTEFVQHSQLRTIATELEWTLSWPPSDLSPWSGYAVREWIAAHLPTADSPSPIALISFSAGVVGAIAAAQSLQRQGVEIAALIAIDGWGVPLSANFPIYRLSHDRQTHQDCCQLGAGVAQFYADPPVPHLDLWRSPHTAWGVSSINPARQTAAQFIGQVCEHIVPNRSDARF